MNNNATEPSRFCSRSRVRIVVAVVTTSRQNYKAVEKILFTCAASLLLTTTFDLSLKHLFRTSENRMFLCCGRKMEEPTDEYDEIPFSLKWRMHFGKHEQDPHTGNQILRLSNNRLIQTHCESTEYHALKLIDLHTSVPAYRVVAVYNRPEGKVVEYEGIPGKALDTTWQSLSLDKKRKIIADLGRFVEQLRKMEPPKHEVIGDATLGGALDHRFGRAKIGPFYSIKAFHEFMRRGHSPQEFRSEAVVHCHERKTPYRLKFTHSNLCPRNVLVDDAGRVSALIGWESAGWYPEYWEYVQMHNAIGPKETGLSEWVEMMEAVVPKYEEELEADRALRGRFTSETYERPRSVYPPSPTASQLHLEQQEIDDKNTENTSG